MMVAFKSKTLAEMSFCQNRQIFLRRLRAQLRHNSSLLKSEEEMYVL